MNESRIREKKHFYMIFTQDLQSRSRSACAEHHSDIFLYYSAKRETSKQDLKMFWLVKVVYTLAA